MKQNLKPAVNITALVLAAGLLIGLLTGCSQSQIGNSKPQPGNSEPQTVTITVKGDQNVIVNEPKTIEVAKGTKWSEVKLKVNVSYKDGYKAKAWKFDDESGADLYLSSPFNNNATVFAVSKKIPQPNDPDLFKTDGNGTITGYTCDKEDLPKALVIPGKIGDEVITEIGESAFRYCTGLTSLDLSGCTSLTTIGEDAFYECTGLTSLDLSACTSLTTIGKYTFEDCTGLNEVKLPANLTEIGQRAFNDCPIETLYIGCDIKDSIISNLTREYSVKQHLKNLKLGEGVSTIGDRAFYGCMGLTEVKLPASLTTIGERAFAFSECTGLTEIKLPANLTTIGKSVFSGCTGLNEVKLPANLTKINNGAFSGCTGLTSLDLSGYTSLTTIGESAFKFCMGLTEIKLPANLTKIGCGAFIYCINLTSAVFANTNGWKVYEYGGGSYIGSISSSNLAVPATAAKYLRKEVSDGGYCDKYWKKD